METANDTAAAFRATYSPNDNKIRIYPNGVRVDDHLGDRYADFKAAGFKWAAKQECFVCPRWTPTAEDWALELAGDVGDEDYSAEERSADRAERFENYRDKRADEAGQSADALGDAAPVFGNQDHGRAARQAKRYESGRRRAVSKWATAQYWQDRLEGVISHAIYRASAPVRRSRILGLESDLRRLIAVRDRYTAAGKQQPASLTRWIEHFELRLSFERSLLESEGGAAFDVEMIPGGWFNGHRIYAVNRSAKTKRVVSVKVLAPERWHRGPGPAPLVLQNVNVERLGADAYRAPTADELQEFEQLDKARKDAAKAAKPKAPPLINPTLEDAQRLQAIWNARAAAIWEKAKAEGSGQAYGDFEPVQVVTCTQARYSQVAAISYSSAETREVTANGQLVNRYRRDRKDAPVAFKVRSEYARTSNLISNLYAVVHITDKPAKPLPLDWAAIEQEATAHV